MPRNINFSVFDATAPPPQDLVGKYDIVHVRLLACAVRNGDPTPFLKNIVFLLSM